VQAALVDAMGTVSADAVMITGDLTTQALPAEFETARTHLQPLLDSVPSIVLCGNHDVYTRGSKRSGRLQQYFSRWMHLDEHGVGQLVRPGLHVIALDPNRPGILSSGRIPDAQLDALPDILDSVAPDAAPVLALHYPVLSRHGDIYDGFEHGLLNASDLISTLSRCARRPAWIVHGHEHHGYHVDLQLDDGAKIPIYNPGSSGYAHLKDTDRAACFNVYTIEAGKLIEVQRYRYGEQGFQPEAGGAYASGR
jgi:3',5'-cyclic AMP phosphodiesterase CpdA